MEVVTLANITPNVWSDPTVAFDARYYSDVEVQMVGSFTPYTPTRSIDGINFVDDIAYDKLGNAITSITAPGIYRLSGSGYLKLTSGAGATVTIRAGA